MRHRLPSGTTSLPKRVSLTLHDRRGDRVECVAGLLWLTQDGDPRDVVLRPGQSLVLDRPGAAIVHALADAGFVIHRRPRSTLARAGRHLQRALRLLRQAATGAPALSRSVA